MRLYSKLYRHVFLQWLVPKAESGLMQWALLTEQTLYSEVRLSVNPGKTELVVFTRERNSQVSLNHIFLGLHYYVALGQSSI
jgi:hypothetical protein